MQRRQESYIFYLYDFFFERQIDYKLWRCQLTDNYLRFKQLWFMALCVYNEDAIPWHLRTESQKYIYTYGLDRCVTNKNVENSSTKKFEFFFFFIFYSH